MSDKEFNYYISGETGKWEVVIGLEVHAQVSSNAKLFSSSATQFGSEPNSQVSLIDAAMPGMLPVINEFCVEQAVKTGLGLKAKINLLSVFDRKNYFYADLPQGYQISQFKHPIVGEGEVILDMPYGTKKIGIERLHLEQDAGKSLHDQDPIKTFIDFVKHLNLSKGETHKSIISFTGEDNKSKMSLEVAMQWNNGFSESVYTFANTINTQEGGTHEEYFVQHSCACVCVC